jgi:hypothetical protein
MLSADDARSGTPTPARHHVIFRRARARGAGWRRPVLAGLAAAVVIFIAGCGSAGRSKVWIISEPGTHGASCSKPHCGPYAIRVRWDIHAGGVTGYEVFLDGHRAARVSGRQYEATGLACADTVTVGVRATEVNLNTSPMYTAKYSAPACDDAPANDWAPYFTADTETAVVGKTLRVQPGSWSNHPTHYSYQWKACRTTGGQPPKTGRCVNIPGAVSATYTIGAADVGHALAAVVTASNSAGPGSTSVSGACAIGENVAASESVASRPPAEPAGCSPISAVVGARDGAERFCSNAFVTCGYVDPLAGTVGVAPGTDLTPVSNKCACLPSGASWDNGILSITGDNVTVHNVYVPGSVQISGTDDKLTQSEVTTGICPSRCASAEPIVVLQGARNAQVKYVTVYGGSNGTLHNGSGQPVLWDHVYSFGSCTGQLGWGDVDNSFIITDIRIAHQAGEGECHTEAGYVPGCRTADCASWGSNPWGGTCPGRCSRPSDYYTSYENDVMLNPQDQTAAIFLDNHAFGATGNYNVMIRGSFVAGGGYPIYGDDSDDASSNIVVSENRWSAMYFANGGSWGACGWNESGTSVAGNVWDDDLSRLTMGCGRHQ